MRGPDRAREPAGPGALLAHALLLPLLGATCVLAPVFVPHRVGKLLASALELAGGNRDARHAPYAAGVTACTFALAIAGACGVGRAAAPAIAHGEGADALVTAVVALLAPALVGAVLAPFLLAPLALLDGEEGVVESIVRSFELAARRGARLTTRDGALLGAGVGTASLVVAGTGGADASVSRVVLLGALATVVIAPLAALALARAYVDARSRPAFAGAADARVARSLRTVALLVVPAALALTLALVAAVLTPAPMSLAPAPGRRAEAGWGPRLVPAREAITIPGEHGLVVRALEHGVSVETADGGGAGVVMLPQSARARDQVDFAVHSTPRGWALVRGAYVTYVDDEGVRLDDDLGDRLAARAGRQTLALLLLAVALGAWWERRMRGTLAEAAALDAPELRRDGAPEPTRLARLSGRLRLDEGSVVATHGGWARVEGAGRFVSSDGETVLALPAEIPLLLPHPAAGIADGAAVALLVRGDAIARLGLREGAIPWPEGARLLASEREDAAEALLSRAARASSIVALAIAAALAWAALAIVTAL